MVEGAASRGESSGPRASIAADSDHARERELWHILSAVPDPEIPVLSIVDLGIVRYVRDLVLEGHRHTEVGLTPTYSGCPATEMIQSAVRAALDQAGHGDVVINQTLSPPWTSDWLTAAARDKLRAFGIAPPEQEVASPRQLLRRAAVACPRCGSRCTQRLSEFGSTPCKAHYRCTDCLEPFDYFKCL
jgi:ring-1,2-phenylacetyl-CoA epoxidase subunit PaaD